MSNRRGGTGGRKAKANNNNKQKGGSSSASSSLPNNGHLDSRHNWDLPCCHLLEEYTQQLWGIEKEAEEAGADAASAPASAKPGPLSPKFFLVQMMRNHFLERRRALEDPTTTTKSAPVNKKKKKKKKKKAKVAATSADEKGETDESDSIVLSLSQDSQSISASFSKDESNNNNNNNNNNSAASAPSAQPAANSKLPAAVADQDDSGDVATTALARKTPVDTYLDRFTEAATRKKQSEDAATPDHSSLTLSPGRDLDAFVRYLNDKYGGPDGSGKTEGNKKSNKGSGSPSGGLSVRKDELEAACQSIACSSCRAAVVSSLRQDFGTLQPVVLSATTFGGNGMDSSNQPFGRDCNGNQTPPRNPQPSNNSNNNNHNGLAIPIHNQKTGHAVSPPPPSVDFDYVALEEGINPMGTLMEIKADLAHVPYFHPQLVPSANISSAAGGGKKQPATSKGGTGEEDPPSRLEWRFVSSSSSPSPSTADKSTDLQEGTSARDEVFITAQDLELIAKDLMLPLGLKPDDLVGANTDLSEDDLALVFEKTNKTDLDTYNNIYDSREKELSKNYEAFREAQRLDDNGEGSNMQIQSPPTYLDLDKSLQHALEEVTKDIIWDRILYLHPKLNQSVVQTSPSWHSASAYLMDACTTAIMEDLECMSEYERCLSELANAQGRIPQMFESRAHRNCFRAMIHRRLQLVDGLLSTAHKASITTEDAWLSPPDSSSNLPVGLSGIALPFCKKWYAEQEFCLQLQKRQKRNAWGPGTQGSNEPEESGAKKSFESSKCPSIQGPEKWVGKIDFHAEDLLTSLLDLTKRVEKGRIDEIREEHNCRCIKVLGVLTKVGQEIFAPLGDDANGSSGRVRLDDEATREACRSLWAQIQDHKNQQARQEFLNEEGGPNMFEQKRTVAALMQLSIRMLRKIRKCLTDKHEPASAPPLMPLSLVSKLAKASKTSESYGHMNPRTVGNSYHSLMEVACFCGGLDRCNGGSGQRRFASLVLTLFFQKLSENCSEWHAALAEEELLTAMSSEDFGLDAGTVGGENTGVNGNAAPSGKSSKKAKKKKAKKTSVVAESAKELNDAPINQQESDQEASKHGSPSDQSDASDLPNGVGEASDALKGHETPKKERTKKASKDSKSKTANTSEIVGNRDSAPQKSQKGGRSKSASTVSSTTSRKVDLSTEDVDRKMGVSNKSGSFQTAESYLVGRLTTLLAQSPKHGGLTKARGGNASVVII